MTAPTKLEEELRAGVVARLVARCREMSNGGMYLWWDDLANVLENQEAEIASLRTRAETAEKEHAALITNCKDFNEAGLEALKQRDEALRDAKFWENLSNGNSASADTWKARAETAEALAEARREDAQTLASIIANVPAVLLKGHDDDNVRHAKDDEKHLQFVINSLARILVNVRDARALTKEPGSGE